MGSLLLLANETQYERVIPPITERLSLKHHFVTRNGTGCDTFAFSLKKLDTVVTHGVFNEYIKFKAIQKRYLQCKTIHKRSLQFQALRQARSKTFGRITQGDSTLTVAPVALDDDSLFSVMKEHKKKYWIILSACFAAFCFIKFELLTFYTGNEMRRSFRETFTPEGTFESSQKSKKRREKYNIGDFILMNEFAAASLNTDVLEDLHQVMMEPSSGKPRQIEQRSKHSMKEILHNIIPSMLGYGV